MNVTGTIDAILGQKSGEVFSVAPDATVYDAVAKMAEKNIGALVVMEGETLVGIISERDYTRKVMLRGKRSRETQVSEIMSTHLTTVEPKESVDHCLQYMTDKRVRHLPVVENGKLCGVISIGDLVKHVISVQSATLKQLESYISGGYAKLKTPDRFAAHDRSHGAAFHLPAVERRVARKAGGLIRVDKSIPDSDRSASHRRLCLTRGCRRPNSTVAPDSP